MRVSIKCDVCIVRLIYIAEIKHYNNNHMFRVLLASTLHNTHFEQLLLFLCTHIFILVFLATYHEQNSAAN